MFREPRKYYEALFMIDGKLGTLRLGDTTPAKAREWCEALLKLWRQDGTDAELVEVTEKTDLYAYDPDNGNMMCTVCGHLQVYPRDGWTCKGCGTSFR